MWASSLPVGSLHVRFKNKHRHEHTLDPRENERFQKWMTEKKLSHCPSFFWLFLGGLYWALLFHNGSYAERAWLGISSSHRSVAPQEKQGPEWEKRTPGGTSWAHTRGGGSVILQCFWLHDRDQHTSHSQHNFHTMPSNYENSPWSKDNLQHQIAMVGCYNTQSLLVFFSSYFYTTRYPSYAMTFPWKMSFCSSIPTLLRKARASRSLPHRESLFIFLPFLCSSSTLSHLVFLFTYNFAMKL